jgi:conjugal transfer pilus assembly protein TraA
MRKSTALFALLVVLVVAGSAYAGTTGTEFQGVYDLIKGWATGYLGRIIALGTFLVGLGVTIVRLSLLPVVAGLAVAITVAFGPTVIEGIASAVF